METNEGSKNKSIKHWYAEDRPREKCISRGVSSLTTSELIAVLIGSGTREVSAVELAKQILDVCDNNLDSLAKLTLNELKKINGVGDAKAITLISAMELARRKNSQKADKKIIIETSEDAYAYIRENLMDLDWEEFWAIFLNTRGEVLKKQMIGKGGVSELLIDPKILFKNALTHYASGIIVAHNHPSQHLAPSKEDISLTLSINEGAKLLNIRLIDHLIVGNDSYFSFSDKEML